MRLSAYCKNCEKQIRFSARASDRAILSSKLGEHINLTCKSCNTTNEYHVNKVFAVHGLLITIIALIILVFGAIATFYLWSPYLFDSSYSYTLLGTIGAIMIPFIIFLVISRSQNHKIHIFNSYTAYKSPSSTEETPNSIKVKSTGNLDQLLEATPKQVPWSEIIEFDKFDERVSAISVLFVNTIGVSENIIEFCPDNEPPLREEILSWIWSFRPDLADEILKLDLSDSLRILISSYKSSEMDKFWDYTS